MSVNGGRQTGSGEDECVLHVGRDVLIVEKKGWNLRSSTCASKRSEKKKRV